MQIVHLNKRPVIDPSAYIAPNATVCGNVTIGAGSRTLFGACVVSEGEPVGASVFHGAYLGFGAEVRVNAVVHLRTKVPAGQTVPIAWVAVGDPVQTFPPDKHEEIWKIQKPLNFPEFVYGVKRPD